MSGACGANHQTQGDRERRHRACEGRHQRTRPGLNHLALHAGGRADLDRITAAAPEHGWRLMFADRHPYAGGPEHLAAFLENDDGFEVELVAAEHTP